ncbi:MAG: preprotein translocase subunit SecD, partial [Gaiellaceae bacterium]|nr:preprotein translocase subunit SecD [Gaiellaceae bacterium]
MRERKPHLILAGLIVLALVGVALLSQKRHVTKGIDLAGGIEVVFKAKPHAGKITAEELSKSKSIMEQRINGTGAKEPDVRTQGSDQIVIELPGVKDPAAALAQIGKTAQLEMYDFETAATGPTKGANGDVVPLASLYKLLTSAGVKPITDPSAV